MFCTIVGYEFQYSGKKAADEAYAQSGQYCQNQPFNKIGYIECDRYNSAGYGFLLVFFYPVCCS